MSTETTAPITTNPTKGSARRWVCLVVLTFGLLGASLAALPGTASAAGNEAQDYVNRINQLRTSLGLNPVAIDANLTELAQAHTQEMADQQNLFHTPDLAAGITSPWQHLSENVGVGSNTDLVWNAFLNSPHHYENLVDPSITHVGVGVVVQGGLQWTTHRFMTMGRAAPVMPTVPQAPVETTPVAPAPTTAPAPSAPVARRPAPTTVVPVTVAPPAPPAPAPAPAPADPVRVDAVINALHQL